MIHGIREEKDENCSQVVENFIKNNMGIKEPVCLQRCHRLGRPMPPNTIGQKSSHPRPIIVNFMDFRQREAVRACRTQLRHPYGVSEDFPFEIRKARESLMPQLRELRRNNKRCSIVWPARLLSEGQIVKEVDVSSFSRT